MEKLTLEQRHRVALSFCLDTIGPRRSHILLDHFGAIAPVWKASSKELRALLGKKTGEALYDFCQKTEPESTCKTVKDAGLSVLFPESPLYPKLLRQIYDPPQVLYWKGQSHLWGHLKRTLAVIGTREPTHYGQKCTQKIVDYLAQHQVTIVSGLARGIDAFAHQSALDALGHTVAVMGTGADVAYPSENRPVYKQLEKEGLIISEFPPGTQARKWTFPMRNRIVSGLSQGVLVVEAGLKSGTLITVDCANEQGRDVFAVPGSIFSKASLGTHKLLQEGAQILTHPAEILTYYGWNTPTPPTEPAEKAPINLTNDEKDVYVLISSVSKHIDEIVEQGALDPGRTIGVLTLLELKGLIEQLPGKYYRKLN